VTAVADAGGQVVISPNTNPEVIESAKAAGLLSMPGFFTPSEAFVALKAGADVLKLFPAEIAGPGGLKAVRAVLPPGTRVYAVGGVEPDSVSRWVEAGASGLGLGSAVFKPGRTAADVHAAASAFVAAWRADERSRTGG
jgi:2-dehydro-3-deoxyphosphogalactonate aldolase